MQRVCPLTLTMWSLRHDGCEQFYPESVLQIGHCGPSKYPPNISVGQVVISPALSGTVILDDSLGILEWQTSMCVCGSSENQGANLILCPVKGMLRSDTGYGSDHILILGANLGMNRKIHQNY